MKKITKDDPVLLLDDVLSELDMKRQKFLLETLGDTQTIITCTGLDEFVNNRALFEEKAKFFTKKYAHPLKKRKDYTTDWDFTYPQ